MCVRDYTQSHLIAVKGQREASHNKNDVRKRVKTTHRTGRQSLQGERK